MLHFRRIAGQQWNKCSRIICGDHEVTINDKHICTLNALTLALIDDVNDKMDKLDIKRLNYNKINNKNRISFKNH